MAEKLKLTILSFACCNPRLGAFDKQYIDRIRQALQELGVEADIDMVHATEVMMAPDHFGWMGDALPLFMKYGASISPALFIDNKLTLFGGVPTPEKIKEELAKHVASHAAP